MAPKSSNNHAERCLKGVLRLIMVGSDSLKLGFRAQALGILCASRFFEGNGLAVSQGQKINEDEFFMSLFWNLENKVKSEV
jgi:hypothetical protein